jgi:hypothetical protein
MSGWFSSVLPVITFVLGAGVAFGRDAFIQRRLDRRESASRKHDVDRANASRREDFELAHLVKVNGLLSAHADAVYGLAETVAESTRARSRSGVTITRLPGASHERVEAAGAAVLAQVGFILDDQIREIVGRTYRTIDGTASIVLAHDDDPEFDGMQAKLQEAYAALSARVREIYAGQAGEVLHDPPSA